MFRFAIHVLSLVLEVYGKKKYIDKLVRVVN